MYIHAFTHLHCIIATAKLPKLLTSPLPHSKSAAKQAHRAKTQAEIQHTQICSKWYAWMKYMDPWSPSPDYVHLISSFPRKTPSIITQLHTGHIPINKYLFHIGKAPMPICPICHQSNETVLHYLLHCPAYHIPRQSLHYKIGNSNLNICHLLTNPNPNPWKPLPNTLPRHTDLPDPETNPLPPQPAPKINLLTHRSLTLTPLPSPPIPWASFFPIYLSYFSLYTISTCPISYHNLHTIHPIFFTTYLQYSASLGLDMTHVTRKSNLCLPLP